MVDNDPYRVDITAGEALFRLGADDDPETVENVDVSVTLHDGTRWSATFLTLDEIGRILDRWRASGEGLGGAYFSCPDLIIVRNGGIPAMSAVLDGLAAQNSIQTTLMPLQ